MRDRSGSVCHFVEAGKGLPAEQELSVCEGAWTECMKLRSLRRKMKGVRSKEIAFGLEFCYDTWDKNLLVAHMI